MATRMGMKSDNIEKPVAAMPSPVETTGFPAPAVNLDDRRRATTLPLCMVAAAPPPTTNPMIHFIHSLSDGKTEVINNVPATTDSGVARVSSRLSTKGI